MRAFRLLLFFQGAFQLSVYLALIFGNAIPLNVKMILGITSPALFFSSIYVMDAEKEDSKFLILLGFIFSIMGISYLIMSLIPSQVL
ncbi:MAG: hypothetical protein ACOCXG_02390 [Nanoarchaeota archaeon]